MSLNIFLNIPFAVRIGIWFSLRPLWIFQNEYKYSSEKNNHCNFYPATLNHFSEIYVCVTGTVAPTT